jgi:glycosyltransferase involved in cell wall biosynthesis
LSDPSSDPKTKVAVAIPCYNEAAAVISVVAEWRAALPDAEIVIFDNNSTDDTAAVAHSVGVRVVSVPKQGKGYAVRAIFHELKDRDAVVMIDGDGTYPADHVGPLLDAVLSGEAEMSVGARRPVDEPGSMTMVRGIGNRIIRLAFRVLIGPGAGDMLSGYRVFGPGFLRGVTLRSRGFEIETELTAEAVLRGLRVFEMPVPYRPRFAGTTSKLRAFRDGRRILTRIVKESARRRPWRPLLLLAVLLALAWLALA